MTVHVTLMGVLALIGAGAALFVVARFLYALVLLIRWGK